MVSQMGLRFSPSKTKAIIFMRHQLVNSRRYTIPPKKLNIYGADIDFLKQHRYLGMLFDSSLTWGPHIKALKTSVESKINILKAISGAEWGADRHTLLMLYKTIVLSKLSYGCQLYSGAADSTINPLKSIQHKCLRIATGALKCAKKDRLEVEAYIYTL